MQGSLSGAGLDIRTQFKRKVKLCERIIVQAKPFSIANMHRFRHLASTRWEGVPLRGGKAIRDALANAPMHLQTKVLPIVWEGLP